jgi:WD40 repeat protein
MKTFWTRVLLLFLMIGLVACPRYPIDFSDLSVVRGTLKGTFTTRCGFRLIGSAWSPDSSKIATLDSRNNGHLIVWDATTGAQLSSVDQVGWNLSEDAALGWTSNSQQVIVPDRISIPEKLRFYNVQNKVFDKEVNLNGFIGASNLYFSRSGTQFWTSIGTPSNDASIASNLKIEIWDVFSGQLVRTFQFANHTYWEYNYALSLNGEQLVYSENATVQVWSVVTGAKTHEWNLPGYSFQGLQFTQDDTFLNGVKVASPNGINPRFVRFNLGSQELTEQAEMPSRLLDFSEDGLQAALSNYQFDSRLTKIQTFNLETGTLSKPVLETNFQEKGKLSPNGQSILLTGEYSLCGLQRIKLSDGSEQKLLLQPSETQTVILQLNAIWQNESQYQVTGSASIGDAAGLTVIGTGYPEGDKYFVNPQTSPIRPPYAKLEIRSNGSQVWSGTLFNYGSQVQANTFSGDFILGKNYDVVYSLEVTRIP